MLILPYSTELRLARVPYVTFIIMALCVVIFYFQLDNREEIDTELKEYCHSIYKPEAKHAKYDYMRRNKDACAYFLQLMHEQPNLENWIEYNLVLFGDDYSREELEEYIVFEFKHYEDFNRNAPSSLDASLVYDPYSFNPFKMLTSALSHADWSHLIFNLIFFFAFAPALEILMGSKWKFIGVLVLIEVIGGILYSFVSIANSTPMPTLGLSGSVMGMIGFSAYMMPRARIRSLVWYNPLTFYISKVSIPAWILAAWYIGWDTYDLFSRTDNGGVNLLAHVAGGFSGYLIARVWFKKQREEIQIELDDEIDYMRSKRHDYLGIMSSFKGDRRRIDSEKQEYLAKKRWGQYMDRLYKLVTSGKVSEAILLILEDYELHSQSPEIYEELFEEIGKWKKKRVYYCVGRLLIDLYIERNKFGKSFSVLEQCFETDLDFIIADPSKVLLLANEAINQKKYELAYNLVRDYRSRYGQDKHYADCLLLEAKLLWQYLDKTDEAISLLRKELENSGVGDASKLQSMLNMISAIH